MELGDCIHYQGTREDCKAGVNLRTLVGGPDFGWCTRLPCRSGWRKPDAAGKCVACTQYVGATQEDVDRHEAETKAMIQRANDEMEKVAPLVARIKKENKNRDVSATDRCPICGKALYWSHARYNGHVHMKCETEDCVSFME